jgi:hypothetical protein
MHVELAAVEYFPAMQSRQFVAEAEAKDAEYVPAGQFVHGSDPFEALYEPGLQGTHAPPAGPTCPRLHMQSSGPVLPGLDTALVAHAVQAVAPAAL